MSNKGKYEKAKEYIASGETISAATKKVGMALSNYYHYKKQDTGAPAVVTIHEAPASTGVRRGPKAGPRATKHSSENVMIIVVPPSRLREVMASL